METLNRECFCLGLDPLALHAQLDVILAASGAPASLAESHPHLFSALPVFVSRVHIDKVARVVAVIDEIAKTAAYQHAVMAWAPDIATFDPGSPGGLLGLDFHLGPDGPRLIEINTNPGGVLLNAMLGRAHRQCMPELTIAPAEAIDVEDAVLAVIQTEWQLQRPDTSLAMIAIVDETPAEQYLYPEFVLFRELFRKHGYASQICSPAELIHRDGRLWLDTVVVDFVYNRLTDFSFAQQGNQPLRSAYLSHDVVVSPHPRSHAIFSDKRNLCLLSDGEFLSSSGLSQATIDLLLATVPRTERVTPDNLDALWERRRRLFFKPAAGYGSKASYRGDKLTRRVWQDIGKSAYVAQELVPPSERRITTEAPPLKVDLRCYAYRGVVLLHAARMYQGQTTNFRTPGGGFAPVLTTRALPAA